jgi:hypothetical protein
MALADYVVQRREVKDFNDKVIATVRGLNFEDISRLVRNHLTELTMVFNSASTGNGKLLPDELDINSLLFSLVVKAPDTAGLMLALGCDEPDAIEKAKLLPAPLQLKILGEIATLTFEDVGGPLAFLQMVKIAVASQRPALTEGPVNSMPRMQ